MPERTVLYDTHVKLGARIVEFAGWEMPVQYSGIIDEHKTVRSNAGLFDVSHMGQVFVSGNDALKFMQKIVPQDISKLALKKAVYCQLPYENGGLVDDLIVYRLEESKYLIIVNASNADKDFDWFKQNSSGFDISLENKSAEYSMLAIQGPKSQNILNEIGLTDLPEFFYIEETQIIDIPAYVARTGYTGEDGFEIITKNEFAQKLWNTLLTTGQKYGIKPIGLGARDTLRLEAALMLYGNDLNNTTTPIEAGLSWSIPTDKEENYNGKQVILSQKANGTAKKLIGFEMTERAIPRHEYEIYHNGQKAGEVTSGGYAPSIDKNIGMGYVDTKLNIKIGSEIEIMVRNKLYKAKVVKRPFIKKNYNK